MKEILDIVVFVLFAIMLAFFIVGFNKQQLKKHKDKLDKIQKRKENNSHDQTSTD